MATAQKLSVSLPPQLAAFLYQYQAETKLSVSKIVADALQYYQDHMLAAAYADYAANATEQLENQLWETTIGDGIK
ncbi:MAG: hypothetical protein WCP79_08860 [Bacillota bacterium]